MLSAKVVRRFAKVLGRYEKDLRRLQKGLRRLEKDQGDVDDDLFQLAKVVRLSDKAIGKEDKVVVHIVE